MPKTRKKNAGPPTKAEWLALSRELHEIAMELQAAIARSKQARKAAKAVHARAEVVA